MTEYPKHARSTGNRYKSRLTYDFAAVHSIVNACSILHVSFVPSQDDPFPAILPMIGQMGSFTNQTADPSLEALDLYIHGSSSSRLMKIPSSSSHVEAGLPVCVAATLLDDIVLALTPFNHSCNYRSAVLHGYASVVDDEAEKFWTMELITDGLVPGRWADTRLPSKAEMQSTTILKIRVESASAKARTGGPADSRKDLNDEAVVKKVWTGVVPVHEQLGEVCEGEKNGAGECPEYIERWRKEKNQKAEGYAKEVAVMKKQVPQTKFLEVD